MGISGSLTLLVLFEDSLLSRVRRLPRWQIYQGFALWFFANTSGNNNILAEVSSGEHMMGERFSTASARTLQVRLTGAAPFVKVLTVKWST